MQSITLLNVLKETADRAIQNQLTNGSFPAGHNGPYFDTETPVRCTAHFLFLLADLFAITKKEKYKKAAFSAISYLKTEEARPNKKTFHCRNKEGKDCCNGLIGQAWVVESLLRASEVFKREDCYIIAEECFLLHPWNEGMSVWNRVEINGDVLSVDRTFNHQLWFALSAAALYKTPMAQARVKNFIINVVAKVELYDNGVIFHDSQLGSLKNYLYSGPKIFLAQVKSLLSKAKSKKSMYSKSLGYHGFNLFALAQLKELLPNESTWKMDLFHKVLSVTESDQFISDLASSEFGYFYNLSGLEIAYAYSVLTNNDQMIRTWINRQFEYTGNRMSYSLTKNVVDQNTAFSRIYIAAKLADYEVVF